MSNSVFFDKQGRRIEIRLDEDSGHAEAWHNGQLIGHMDWTESPTMLGYDGEQEFGALLTNIYLDKMPGYKGCGIGTTSVKTRFPSNPPPQTLGCRTHEGKCAGLGSACLSTAKPENCSQSPPFHGEAASAVVDSHHQNLTLNPHRLGVFIYSFRPPCGVRAHSACASRSGHGRPPPRPVHP